jgi:tRNA pseudouridine55 synthase
VKATTTATDSSASGVLVVDKPAGPTSHDVVDAVRQAYGQRRVGHTGTLDPFATGVLPVCLGKATRLARFLGSGDKVYVAVVQLGWSTTTDDREGEPLGDSSPVSVDRLELEQVCASFVGELRQIPPAYSAKRKDGRRHYERARRGESVPREPVAVSVRDLQVGELDAEGRFRLEVRCSPGTYIRSLARDIGEKLGVGGHLRELRRTRSGSFDLSEAVPLDGIAEARERLLPLSALLPELPAVRVGPAGVEAVRNGRDLGRSLVLEGFPAADPPGRLRVLAPDGQLLGLAVPRGFDAPGPGLSHAPALHADVVLAG